MTAHPTSHTARTAGGPHRTALAAVCLGHFLVVLDVTAVTVALPVIGDALDASVTALQWVADGYTLVFAGLLPFSGGLADRIGARRVFLTGLALFTLASAGCAAACSAPLLVLARLVQGCGAALLLPASLALLRAMYAHRAARARAIGLWGAVSGLAAGAGPVLGGLLAQGLGWRAVFLVNLPVGAAGALLTLRCVPAPPGRSRGGLDLPAQSALAVSLAALVTALVEAGALGWTHPAVLGAAALCPAGTLVFLRLEGRARAPMLPLPLLTTPGLRPAVAIGALLNLGFYGLLFLAPLYFQRLHHYGVLRAGCALLPAVAVVAPGSALAGRVMARTGPRPPMAVGLGVGALGLLGWLLAGPATGYPALVAPMAAVGFGTALTMPAATLAATEAAAQDRAGAASAIFNTARQSGSALGVAVFGSLSADRLVTGLHISALIGATGFLAAAALAVRYGSGPSAAR
ncbi:MFS transporter [Streptomyces sulfonofaciens]|uniref:MFS transporter n=1 Tax=Streptomyces sulfonofaciens TaxID=68272 RepID=A0A919KU82_9ACTN|nr:MFS transporter [Streptomyces sulfonofaciens]GHH72834.1 MFS transporter [Streptomyces sulfonofaciens]